MAYCPECGSEVVEEGKFCQECGSELPAQHQSSRGRNQQGQGQQRQPQATHQQQGSQPAGNQGQTTQRSTHGGQARGGSVEAETEDDSFLGGWTNNQKVIVGGGLVAAVSAVLPWLSITIMGNTLTMYGFEGDGLISGGMAVLVILVGAYSWERPAKATVAVLGLGILAIGLLYITNPLFGADLSGYTTTQQNLIRRGLGPTYGVWGTTIGGLAIVLGVAEDVVS
jgi:hypothetical protein